MKSTITAARTDRQRANRQTSQRNTDKARRRIRERETMIHAKSASGEGQAHQCISFASARFAAEGRCLRREKVKTKAREGNSRISHRDGRKGTRGGGTCAGVLASGLEGSPKSHSPRLF